MINREAQATKKQLQKA